MRIIYNLYQDDVVALLSTAAARDDRLLKRDLNKVDIRETCRVTIGRYGFENTGWQDHLTDSEAASVEEWASAQASKYEF